MYFKERNFYVTKKNCFCQSTRAKGYRNKDS
uniref:Uncharacterized protein n=1 Tax=Rhizophora mucronata TaxID=61149 RepID=A0A2P2QF67_RHIMU